MDVDIRFSESAFKHGVTTADIRWAFDNVLYDEQFCEGDENSDIGSKHLLIGFDRNANHLEILYNVIDENTLRVFHAMKCRNIFLTLI
ncbi:MAG: hypothetical protein LBI14_04290 [Treponema sp.]|jgi:uncharacterized DUF497 family protein|nr:hypothetical protein [Treponema sp.]